MVGFLAHLTLETLCVPRLVQSFDPPLTSTNRQATSRAFDTEQFLVAALAVRVASVNIETLRADGILTVGADEAGRVVVLVNCLHTLLWAR